MSVLEQGYDEDFTGLGALIDEMDAAGQDFAEAKAAYYKAKAVKALELRASGMPVGVIEMVVKGDCGVNDAMFRMDCAASLFKAAQERVMAKKIEVRSMNDTFARS